MPDQILVTPAQLRDAAEQLQQAGQRIQTAVQAVDGEVQRLAPNIFDGRLAAAYRADFASQRDTLNGMAGLLTQFAAQLERAASTFETADSVENPVKQSGQAFASNWLEDLEGVGEDGWILANTTGFDQEELLYQSGGTCTLYAMLNLLVANGIDIDEQEASEIVERMKAKYNRDDGFPIEAAEDILRERGVEYTRGRIVDNPISQFRNDFIEGVEEFFTGEDSAPGDRHNAERFLIDTLSQGKAVYVQTEVDDMVGLSNAAHAWTVLGVRTDDQGNVTQVLLSDNGNNIEAYDADLFIDDWLNYRHGNYIVLD